MKLSLQIAHALCFTTHGEIFTDLNVKKARNKILPSPVEWWYSEFFYCVLFCLLNNHFYSEKNVPNENIQLVIDSSSFFY